MLEDSRGRLWFGTPGDGVVMYDGTYLKNFGVFGIIVLSLMEDSQGNLWFGTRSTGLMKYDGTIITYITPNEGLSHSSVQAILEDSRGNIWIGTRKGMSIVEAGSVAILNDMQSRYPAGLTQENTGDISGNYVIRNYSLQVGLKSMRFTYNSALIDSKNRTWWGNNGLITLDMHNYKFPDLPPSHLQIDRIDIDGELLDYRLLERNENKDLKFSCVTRFSNCPSDLVLPFKLNHLSFHFPAIDWYAPHNLRYSHKMVGLDESWSEPSPGTSVDYRSLPFGRYTLKIRAIIRWRTASLKQRQEELEQTVKERTVEISDKNEELKQQNEELASQRDEIQAQRDEIEAQSDMVTNRKRSSSRPWKSGWA